jgi:hypothetical protein
MEISLASHVLSACKNYALFGELSTLIELSKRHENVLWKGGSRFSHDIECNGKRIEVKSCNIDNLWAKNELKKDQTFESGFDKIYPKRFDYLVCVSFKGDFSEIKYYVFTPSEAEQFKKGKWKKFPEAYNIEIRKYPNQKLNQIIANSLNAWSKIK